VTARQPRLLYPGTKVTAVLGGHTAYGVVEDYEHYRMDQTTFPVKFGGQTRIMNPAEVTVLPEAEQPDERRSPRCLTTAALHPDTPCTPVNQLR
jgi:hypothetical protein